MKDTDYSCDTAGKMLDPSATEVVLLALPPRGIYFFVTRLYFRYEAATQIERATFFDLAISQFARALVGAIPEAEVLFSGSGVSERTKAAIKKVNQSQLEIKLGITPLFLYCLIVTLSSPPAAVKAREIEEEDEATLLAVLPQLARQLVTAVPDSFYLPEIQPILNYEHHQN